MAANKTIGGINVTITATIDKFAKTMTLGRKMIGSFVSSIKGLVFNLKTLGAALAVGGLTKLVANQFEAINALKDLADKTGVSTDKLAGLQLAAEEAGISNAVLEKGLVKLNNEMGMAGDVALRQWIEKTSKLTTQHEKLAAATAMFGARGADMVRFLNGGTAALDEAQSAAESMGLAITQDVAIGVDRASEAFARFKMSVTGIFRALAGEIAPFVELLSMKASAFVASTGGTGIGKFIADVIVEMAKNVADSMQRMVVAVLDMAAIWMDLANQIRSSNLAGHLGLSVPTESDFSAATNLRNRAAFLRHERNLPSTAIQKFVDEARKQSADAAAQWKATLGGPDLLDQIGGFAKRLGIGPARTIAGAAQGLGGMLSQQFGWMAKAAGMIKAPESSKRPALSFAESGSVESYRQQAAIRRQSENIEKKQLGAQEKMVVALNSIDKKLMPMKAAGFA